MTLHHLSGRLPWVARRRAARRQATFEQLVEQLPEGSIYVRLHTRPPLRAVGENGRKLTWKGDARKDWKNWNPE